jgi:hypothetical protein
VIDNSYFDGFFADIERLGIDKEMTSRFFFVFSRFEFGLKKLRYLEKKDYASPDWNAFSDTIKDEYIRGENQNLDDAVKYLCDNPVKKQIRSNDAFEFKCISKGTQSDIEFAIQSVQVVRNNLFHGGKFPSGPVTDPGRDSKLLSAGLIVLAQCLEWDSKMREKFFEIDK